MNYCFTDIDALFAIAHQASPAGLAANGWFDDLTARRHFEARFPVDADTLDDEVEERSLKSPQRYRHRPLHAAPTESRVHPLPGCRRRPGARQQARSRHFNHPKVMAWLARHPSFVFDFTPTSASWLKAVEGFFAKLTRRHLRGDVFRSLVDLQAAINVSVG